MTQQSEIKPAGYIPINNDLGVFLDPGKYAPILKINDEAAVVLRLSLLMENFLEVFIKNIREPGTEKYVHFDRYFMQKAETSVALGLPVMLADAVSKINSLRNKFAHKIDYVMTSSDYDEIEKVVNAIPAEVVNPEGRFNLQSAQILFDDGVDALMFIKNQPFATPAKLRQLHRLVGAIFILANKCAFFALNEMQRKGTLRMGELTPSSE